MSGCDGCVAHMCDGCLEQLMEGGSRLSLTGAGLLLHALMRMVHETYGRDLEILPYMLRSIAESIPAHVVLDLGRTYEENGFAQASAEAYARVGEVHLINGIGGDA